MSRPIYGSRLLLTARRLATGTGPGRPALSDLRRATSTAYYALFHQIIRHGAFDFLPSATEEEAAEIVRWFTHAGILEASGLVMEAASANTLDNIRRGRRTSVMALRSAAESDMPQNLSTVADAFQSLQEARHSADYDGNYDPVRAVTINHIDDADTALRSTWSLWRAGWSEKPHRLSAHAAYLTFLRLFLLKSGGPKAR